MAAATAQYTYKVRDSRGKFVEGKVEAASEVAVADKLRAMGYVPLEVKAANVGMQREINFGPKKRVKTKDLAVFSRQFATMIDAGLITYDAGLENCSNRTDFEGLVVATRSSSKPGWS